MLAAGSRIDRYLIERLLASGGTADVYLARDEVLDRDVALKVIAPRPGEDAGYQERVRAEARIAAKLSHPAIIPIHDVLERDGLSVIVMRHAPGGTLRNRMSQRLTVAETVKLLAPIADALDYAHASGMVHRDVKPTNIVLDQHGAPLLTDFGIAAPQSGVRGPESGVMAAERPQTPDPGLRTVTDLTSGTPAYIAPEQAMGQEVTGAADQFSLAVVAYELLTGALPFAGDTSMAMLVSHATADPRPPRQLAPELPPAAERALLRALARDPAARYPTVRGFIAALAASVRGDTEVFPPIPPPPPPPWRRLPRGALLAFGGLVAVAIIGGAAWCSRAPGTGENARADDVLPTRATPSPGASNRPSPPPTPRPSGTPTPPATPGVSLLASFVPRLATPPPPCGLFTLGGPCASPTPLPSGLPARVVLSAASVAPYLTKADRQKYRAIDELFTAAELGRVSRSTWDALKPGSGVTYGFTVAEDTPYLQSGAFEFASEREAQTAMSALRTLAAAFGPRTDSAALIRTVVSTRLFRPPPWLGDDALHFEETGALNPSMRQVKQVNLFWRRGKLISYQSYTEPTTADQTARYRRLADWLGAQDRAMPR